MLPMLFFDIDGTLLDPVSFTYPQSTIDTLKKLKKKGYRLGVATGRGRDSFLRTKVVDLVDWDAVIISNGQTIYDGKLNILYETALDPDAIRQCLDKANELGYVMLFKANPRFITGPCNAYVQEVHDYFHNIVPPVGTYTGQKVDALIIYAPKGYDYQPFKEIKGLNVMPCALSYAEVSPEGVSKASAIQRVLNNLKIDEYIAFGDSPNDNEMLEKASYSIAMGDSIQQVKDHADFVTKNLLDDGIEYACKQLKLI